jgi:MazG family protein
MNPPASSLERLTTIMDELREQCPWDRKQTIQSLRSLTIEETYELADAISHEDWKGIKEELGDLLLHVVFYARIGREQNQFTLQEVVDGICEKLISRHPHVYGSGSGKIEVKDEEDVKRNWENLKLQEGKSSVLSGVPRSLPALVKAMRLQEKAKQVGFEWSKLEQVWEKVVEETGELQQAISEGKPLKVEEEFGDLVFSLINYARFLQIDPEHALERTNQKFMERFSSMEQQARASGKRLSDMTLAEMDSMWNSAKLQKSTD